MTSRTGNLRSESTGYPEFIMAVAPSVHDDKRERIAEWLLLAWLKNMDRNILGLRRVDEIKDGRLLPMVHIAIPLDYRRKQLAQTLGISQLENERKAPRINLAASARWNRPHSYIRVHAAFLAAQTLGAIRTRLMRPSPIDDRQSQAPQRLDHSATNHHDDKDRLKCVVMEGFARRNISIKPHQIQILTHRETRETWVRIREIDRGLRTTIRLAIKQAGIHALLDLRSSMEGAGWSISFAATEAPKLLRRSSDSFDVHAEDELVAEQPDGDDRGPSGSETVPAVRLFAPPRSAHAQPATAEPRPADVSRERSRRDGGRATRSVS